MMNGLQVMSTDAEQILDRSMNREKSLGLCR